MVSFGVYVPRSRTKTVVLGLAESLQQTSRRPRSNNEGNYALYGEGQTSGAASSDDVVVSFGEDIVDAGGAGGTKDGRLGSIWYSG